MKYFSLLAALFLTLFAAGCVKQNLPVQFDLSDPLALDVEIQWAVVTEPYVACYESADYASRVVTHFRKAAILQIIGESTVTDGTSREKWYAFEEGWLPASNVAVYANKMRAQTAVKQLGTH
ncbi:MAG: hypothetical protein II684_05795 [Treponema sp.]|nr:hypothetical protein [Treponema sp.]